MPARNKDLHGMVPDQSSVALVLVDVINDLDFEGGELLLPYALKAAERIAELKRRCKERKIPVIYVNDNWGRWQSDLSKLMEHCVERDAPGKPMVQLLAPEGDDYFVLKPKHSGFFSTTLDVLLSYLGVKTIILTGFAGNICILFTANDAYMRDFHLVIPADCCASNTEEENALALEQMRKILKADITPSTELDLNRLCGTSAREPEHRPRSEADDFAREKQQAA